MAFLLGMTFGVLTGDPLERGFRGSDCNFSGSGEENKDF